MPTIRKPKDNELFHFEDLKSKKNPYLRQLSCIEIAEKSRRVTTADKGKNLFPFDKVCGDMDMIITHSDVPIANESFSYAMQQLINTEH